MSNLATVPLNLIEAGTRLRSINEDQVAALIASIGDVGLLNPVTLYPRQVPRANVAVAGWGLVAGLHRLEACRRLAWTEIPALVVEMSDLHRQLAECDENLCGSKLTPSERALFTRRRKDAYEALHPETRNGANQHNRVGKLCQPNFAQDTAAKTGQSDRTVRLDATRGERIDDDVLAGLRGTEMDKGTVLDRLAALPKADQKSAIDRMKSEPQPHGKSALEAMKAAWHRADKQEQLEISAWVREQVMAGVRRRMAALLHEDARMRAGGA